MTRLLLCALFLFSLSLKASAAETPHTCLVLSGGGARGMAHVGVIKVLERERIPVDCIVGTSMGAVVGSLYASGYSADEIEAQLRALDWDNMFVDRVDRSTHRARRKQQDRSFLADAGLGLRNGKLGLPPSLFEGQRLAIELRRALVPVAMIDDFDALPIRFRAVGTDLETGDAVIMDRGDLVNAVRASMAIPGVFSPVSYGDKSVIDGGAAMNLPIEVAQQLGAKRIIAVDISAALKTRDQLLDPFSITDQMVTALMQKETRKQKQLLGVNDVLIVPALGELSSADFKAGLSEGIPLGEKAAQQSVSALNDLKVDETRYASWRSERKTRLLPLTPIAEIKVVNTSALSDQAITAQMSSSPGELVDVQKIENDLNRLYGEGEFSRAYYTLSANEKQQTVLTYVTRSRRWEEDGSLRFGVFLQDDFDGESRYQIGARFARKELNALGADLQIEARIGDLNRLLLEWNQPLNKQRDIYLRPSVAWEARNEYFAANGDLGDFRRRTVELRAQLGHSLGTWGEISIAPFARNTQISARDAIAQQSNIATEQRSGGFALNFILDTQDDAEFPSKGWYFNAEQLRYMDVFGADTHGFANKLELSKAYSALGGRWLFSAKAHERHSSAIDDVVYLGGPLNLSGYSVEALRGDKSALLSAQYSYPLAQILQYPLFLGGSVEAGSIRTHAQAFAWDDVIAAGSVYAALDTPLGPVYFGYGHAEGRQGSWFIRIGVPD